MTHRCCKNSHKTKATAVDDVLDAFIMELVIAKFDGDQLFGKQSYCTCPLRGPTWQTLNLAMKNYKNYKPDAPKLFQCFGLQLALTL